MANERHIAEGERNPAEVGDSPLERLLSGERYPVSPTHNEPEVDGTEVVMAELAHKVAHARGLALLAVFEDPERSWTYAELADAITRQLPDTSNTAAGIALLEGCRTDDFEGDTVTLRLTEAGHTRLCGLEQAGTLPTPTEIVEHFERIRPDAAA